MPSNLRKMVDRGRIVVYPVAHPVRDPDFNELPHSAAHGGTIINRSGQGLCALRCSLGSVLSLGKPLAKTRRSCTEWQSCERPRLREAVQASCPSPEPRPNLTAP